MYSRNRDIRDDLDGDMSEDEYEIYRYNIPPRYDGSRFRSRRRESAERGRTGTGSGRRSDGAGNSGMGSTPVLPEISRGGDFESSPFEMVQYERPARESDDAGRDIFPTDDMYGAPEFSSVLDYGAQELPAPIDRDGGHSEFLYHDGTPEEHDAETEHGVGIHTGGGNSSRQVSGGIFGGLRLGGEELLILAIIYMVSGESCEHDDVIPLLAILLLAGR